MLDSKHPSLIDMISQWKKLRHCYAGEKAVKDAGLEYLPATPGMWIDGMNPTERGYKNYLAYKQRARFPGYMSRAVSQMIGAMHSKAPVVELPPQLDTLRKRASFDGESLEMLLRRVNTEQILMGRIGLMLDLPAGEATSALPYVATYDAETITNWDQGYRTDSTLGSLNLVVLTENYDKRNADLSWEPKTAYRVLVLGDLAATEPVGIYRAGVFEDSAGGVFTEAMLIDVKLRGQVLNQIPFVFINTTDLLPTPMNSPLLELADLSLTIYRGEADFRLNLANQSQETLVVIGEQKFDDDGNAVPWRVGMGASITIPYPGEVKYIGVSAAGLAEQAKALEADKREAVQLTGRLLDAVSRDKESGEALQTRVAAETATLTQIATTGAEGLRKLLQMAAMWVGADPEQVVVEANTNFANAGLTPAEFVSLMDAKDKGLPLSEESIFDLLKEAEYSAKTFAEEMTRVRKDKETRASEMLANQQRMAALQGAMPPRGGTNEPPE